MKARILVLTALTAVAVTAIPGVADARRTVLVRDGVYTENKGGGPLIHFKVQNRKIVSMRSYVAVICASPGTAETGERLFFISNPPTIRIPRSGRATASFRDDDVSRAGQIDMVVEVQNRSKIDVEVTANVGGTDEACHGVTAFQARRAVPGRRPAGAATASRSTVVVRNGNYGKIEADGQGIGFKVRRNVISKINAIVTMSCRSRDTGDSNDTTFLIREAQSPNNIRIGRNGKAARSWDVRDADREGTVTMDWDFSGRRPKVLIRLISVSAFSECAGTPEFTVRRGAAIDPPSA